MWPDIVKGMTVFTLVCGLFLMTAAVGSGEQPEPPGSEIPSDSNGRHPLITISKETTFVSGPLREDGTIDFVAALNAHASRGITSENNFVVLFWRAMGPTGIPEEFRSRYFKALGIDPLPENGAYHVPFVDFARQKLSTPIEEEGRVGVGLADQLVGLESRIGEHPWRSEDIPIAAAWLKANQVALDLVVEATKRPHMFSPLVSDEDSLMESLSLNHIQLCREAARALQARAMFHLGSQDIEMAWQDASAIRRLGRLTAKGPFLIDLLVGCAISGVADSVIQRIVLHADLSAEQSRRFREELAGMGHPVDMIRTLEFGERMYTLDAICEFARSPHSLLSNDDSTHVFIKVLLIRMRLVDWNQVLKVINLEFDRLVQAARLPAGSERRIALEEAFDSLEAMQSEFQNRKSLAWSFMHGEWPVTTISRQMGSYLSSLLMPAARATFEAETRCRMHWELSILALALAEYRAKAGKYPDTLNMLAPDYLHEVPIDQFTGHELRYSSHDDGYLLYSVGADKKDNQGLSFDEGADDLSVRMRRRERETVTK